MAEDLLKSIKQISRERGINPDIFFSAIKEALLTVSKKYFDPNATIQIEILPRLRVEADLGTTGRAGIVYELEY